MDISGNGKVKAVWRQGKLPDLREMQYGQDLPFVKMRIEGTRRPGVRKNPLRSAIKKGLVGALQSLPLKKQVFFYTIRDDGKLEGNAAALYPWVKGKKVIAAKRLPHPKKYELDMFWQIMRSKVIVTDDYVRYLRHFPLKKDQRVVQLWHACGAFKKFGRYGTNLRESVDLATHAQYSLASVSGEAVRQIYADAFGIPVEKVQALGDPRTDIFFDEKKKEKIRAKVYEKYPRLQGKRVILYAPTFRDKEGEDRTVFSPEIDFARLSRNLPGDMVFVIRPHPIVKKPVLGQQYENILEIRDLPTNDLMFVSSLMVTDYSSVIFEYSLLRKPILFFCYDIDSYDRGFYLRYPDDLPGEVITDQEELEDRLSSERWNQVTEGYDEFVRKYMSACDGRSSERIAEVINRYIR